ncbi:hypothetical protein D9611_013827 [Ephemerocybe angulata]|uniref:F-box domain-containing protein n=1 Tax=Ephemerocybe angulata TaxID=980116 RepID=A0A8H5C4B8_9AGAR|nr:hypothetical protein D9611_013827 [Tulosesus angulatus]
MGKRKVKREDYVPPTKKARGLNDVPRAQLAATSGIPTGKKQQRRGDNPVKCLHIQRLPNEILLGILEPLICGDHDNVTGEAFGLAPENPPAYTESSVGPHYASRAILRSVCSQWNEFIVSTSRFWSDISINGNRIPSPMFDWTGFCRGDRAQTYVSPDFDDGEEREETKMATTLDEVSTYALFLKRAERAHLSIVLVDPTYDPETRYDIGERPYVLRPGLNALQKRLDAATRITSLSIRTRDINYLKDMLVPGVSSDGRRLTFGGLRTLTETNKIDLCTSACASIPGIEWDDSPVKAIATKQHRAIIIGDENQVAVHERVPSTRAKWTELHTLRIDVTGHNHYIDKLQCILSGERFPKLRHLEIKLCERHELCLLSFPYAQLTHLTLTTTERNTVILGVLHACISLESSEIMLHDRLGRHDSGGDDGRVVLPSLKRLSIKANLLAEGFFFNALKFPKLELLDVECQHAENSLHILGLVRRSQCALKELRLNYRDGTIDDLEVEFAGYMQRKSAENVRNILDHVSESLEQFSLRAGKIDQDLLKDVQLPRLQLVTVTSCGKVQSVPDGLLSGL